MNYACQLVIGPVMQERRKTKKKKKEKKKKVHLHVHGTCYHPLLCYSLKFVLFLFLFLASLLCLSVSFNCDFTRTNPTHHRNPAGAQIFSPEKPAEIALVWLHISLCVYTYMYASTYVYARIWMCILFLLLMFAFGFKDLCEFSSNYMNQRLKLFCGALHFMLGFSVWIYSIRFGD
jgi:hypothetical protein